MPGCLNQTIQRYHSYQATPLQLTGVQRTISPVPSHRQRACTFLRSAGTHSVNCIVIATYLPVLVLNLAAGHHPSSELCFPGLSGTSEPACSKPSGCLALARSKLFRV